MAHTAPPASAGRAGHPRRPATATGYTARNRRATGVGDRADGGVPPQRTGTAGVAHPGVYDATDDLHGQLPPQVLADRFLTWARPR